jgi:AcrR family transcriptional regulator
VTKTQSRRKSDSSAPSTRQRLLEAALRRSAVDGIGALSLQTIADEADVSKALVLYHFRDKDDVMSTLVEWTTSRVLAREATALVASTPATVLEELWRWLEAEIARGELRALIELAGERGARTRQANEASSIARHLAAEETMTQLFKLLHLTPRVPIPMLAASELAMREGLVLAASREPARATRAGFDVFWLALLRLAQ